MKTDRSVLMPRQCIRLLAMLMLGAVATFGEATPPAAGEFDAAGLVKRAFDYYRGEASRARVRLTIHRPDWERTQVLHAWTIGEEQSLFTIVEPAKDRGNGTLKIGGDMWTYNPKVNRIIKLPASMMAQAWMGSDFSNNDLAKADSLVKEYSHRLIGTESHEGKVVYIIESVPLPGAPVIWGKEQVKIRADLLFLEEAFFDENGELVKTLSFTDIAEISGKLYARELRMVPADKPGQYTLVEYLQLEFLESLPGFYFTQATLRNPPVLETP